MSFKIRDTAVLSGEHNSRVINCTLFTPDTVTNTPGVLFLPGYRSSRDLYTGHALVLTERIGATCLTVDISGHGDTPGDLLALKRQDLVDDALAAYDALSSQETVNSARMGIVGASFGAYLAVLLSRNRDPKSLLLRAPAIKEGLPEIPTPESLETRGFLSKIPGFGHKIPSLYSVVESAAESDDEAAKYRAYLPQEGLLRVISEFEGPITIVESEEDTHIKHEYIEACLKVAQRGTHRVLAGAGHMLTNEDRLTYRSYIMEWARAL